MCLLLAVVMHLWMWPAFGETMDKGEIREQLLAHVRHLSVTLGERSIYRPQTLKEAEDYVFRCLKDMGYQPRRQPYVCQKVGYRS